MLSGFEPYPRWVPLLGVRGFSCTVSGFCEVSCLRPLAEHVSADGRQNEAPRRTPEKTSGTQGKGPQPRIVI